jgi:hypothetical protein
LYVSEENVRDLCDPFKNKPYVCIKQNRIHRLK